MTVSTTNRKAGPFIGNDSTTELPFTMRVFSEADLVVTELVVATGAETVKTLTTHYTVALNGNQSTDPGGTVTLLTALATGKNVVVTTSVDELQSTSIENQGGFLPQVITDALDKLTILVQQLRETANRSVTIPVSDATISLELPSAADRASKVLSFDASGVPETPNATTDVTAVAASIANVDTVAADIASVNTVAADIASVIATAANEADIDYVAANLPAIQSAADIITMSNASLTLVLDNNAEVAGVNYNTVEAAYAYALTVLQVGGTLTLTIAASTTITETAAAQNYDLNRIRMVFVGTTEATSKWDVIGGSGTYGVLFQGSSGLAMSNMTVTDTGTASNTTPIRIDDSQFTELSAVTLVGNTTGTDNDGFRSTNSHHVNLIDIDITCNGTGVRCDRTVDFRVEGLITRTGSETDYLMEVINQSRGVIDDLTFNGLSVAGGLFVDNASTVLEEGTITYTNCSPDRDPIPDVPDNYGSKIITKAGAGIVIHQLDYITDSTNFQVGLTSHEPVSISHVVTPSSSTSVLRGTITFPVRIEGTDQRYENITHVIIQYQDPFGDWYQLGEEIKLGYSGLTPIAPLYDFFTMASLPFELAQGAFGEGLNPSGNFEVRAAGRNPDIYTLLEVDGAAIMFTESE